MRSNDELIQVFGSIRHDWLNVLQLIKGNLALGNQERVMAVIQEAVVQTANESRLCSLGMPKTTLLLLEQKWSPAQYPLEIEVDGVLFQLAAYDELLYTCFDGFFTMLDQAILAEDSGQASISFTFFDNKCLIELSYDNDLDENMFQSCWDLLPSTIKVEQKTQKGYAVTILLDTAKSLD